MDATPFKMTTDAEVTETNGAGEAAQQPSPIIDNSRNFVTDSTTGSANNNASDFAADNASEEEATCENDAKSTVNEPVFSCEKQLDAIEMSLEQLANLFRAKIDRSEYELETLRKQSNEIQEYRSDLYVKLTKPLLQSIIQIHSNMMKTVERFSQPSGEREEHAGSIPVSTVEIFCEELEDLLNDNGVQRFSVKPGVQFMSGEMRIIGKATTAEENLIGTVAETASDGYRLNGTCIAPARVKVYVEK